MRTEPGMRLRGAAYFFLVFFILLTFFSAPPFVCISSLLCAALHELSHVLCARALKRKVRPLAFSVTGLYPDVGRGSALSCVLIYAAGPFINIVLCAVFFAVHRHTGSETFFVLFSVNAALAVYNLIPVPFSDGGGIARCLLGVLLGAGAGKSVCDILELVFSFALFVFFSYRFFIVGSGFFPFFCSFAFMLCSIRSVSAE